MSEKIKRPSDTNQHAKLIVDVTVGEKYLPEKQPSKKNPHAVALGKLGGEKGGKNRALKLNSEEKTRIASHAAKQRWNKNSVDKKIKKS